MLHNVRDSGERSQDRLKIDKTYIVTKGLKIYSCPMPLIPDPHHRQSQLEATILQKICKATTHGDPDLSRLGWTWVMPDRLVSMGSTIFIK